MDCQHQDGNYVYVHVQKMKLYIDRLGNLGVKFPKELVVDMVLNSFSTSYHHFVMNSNMNNIEKTLMDLHVMLRTIEANLPKTKRSNPTAPVWPLGMVQTRRRSFQTLRVMPRVDLPIKALR